MTTQEVANELTRLCAAGKFAEAVDKLYGNDIVSVEAIAPPGKSRESSGLATIKAKGKWWEENHEVHSSKVSAPLVAGSHFAVSYHFDVTFKPEKRHMQMEELAVYKVKDGKIVREEFFYDMGGMP